MNLIPFPLCSLGKNGTLLYSPVIYIMSPVIFPPVTCLAPVPGWVFHCGEFVVQTCEPSPKTGTQSC